MTEPKCPVCNCWVDSEGHSFTELTATCPKIPAGHLWAAPAEKGVKFIRKVEDHSRAVGLLTAGSKARAFDKLISDLGELGDDDLTTNAGEMRAKLLREMASE